jgi:hypothetical protein
MREAWRRWSAVTARQLLGAAAAAAATTIVLDHYWIVMHPAIKLSWALVYALYAIPFRYAVAAVEPLDGTPVPYHRYVLAAVAAASLCGLMNAFVIRASVNVFGHEQPRLVDFWTSFFPPLVNGLALIAVHASLRNKAYARRRLLQAELARAEQSQAAARTRLEAFSQRVDVEALRSALLAIDLDYERDPSLAGARIDELIDALRAKLQDPGAAPRGESSIAYVA